MTAVLMTLPVIKFTDSTGAPLAGGKVYFFAAGTSTPKDTYTTAAGNVANTNPVILDSQGAAVIFLSGSYKVNVTDSTGTQQSNWPVDNITSFSTGSSGGTFSDATFTIQNAADPTKQVIVSAAGLTTGTTITATYPAASFTFATKASVDALGATNAFGTQLLHVRDEKSSGTQGGTFTSGSWQTRVLNTVKTNEITSASLASNQITLPAGTYYIDASAPGTNATGCRHVAKLYNITDSADIIIGTTGFANGGGDIRSFVDGRFTLAGTKVLELQHQTTVTQATTGFGSATTIGSIEVYSIVKIWKVA